MKNKTAARRRKIALVFPGWIDYCRELTLGVFEYQATQQRLDVKEFQQFGEFGAPPPIFNWKPDGAIVFTGEHEHEMHRTIRDLEVPVVNTAGGRPIDRWSCVYADIQSATHAAVKHFNELGLTNIAFVGVRNHDPSQRTFHALQCLLAEQKILPEICFLGNYVQGDGIEPELGKLLVSASKPLAVQCVDDIVAEYVCRVTVNLGLKIPEDIAVMSQMDSTICLSCHPQLSSVRLPGKQIGHTAADLLDRVIQGEAPPNDPIRVPGSIVAIRGSTWCLSSSGIDIDYAQRFIRENACKGISVSAVVATQNVSRVTFDRLYKKMTGHTPAEEIRYIKVEHAKKLLIKTDMTAIQIAGQCGFSGTTQFNQIFKRSTGMTPIAFRKSKRT